MLHHPILIARHLALYDLMHLPAAIYKNHLVGLPLPIDNSLCRGRLSVLRQTSVSSCIIQSHDLTHLLTRVYCSQAVNGKRCRAWLSGLRFKRPSAVFHFSGGLERGSYGAMFD